MRKSSLASVPESFASWSAPRENDLALTLYDPLFPYPKPALSFNSLAFHYNVDCYVPNMLSFCAVYSRPCYDHNYLRLCRDVGPLFTKPM